MFMSSLTIIAMLLFVLFPVLIPVTVSGYNAVAGWRRNFCGLAQTIIRRRRRAVTATA